VLTGLRSLGSISLKRGKLACIYRVPWTAVVQSWFATGERKRSSCCRVQRTNTKYPRKVLGFRRTICILCLWLFSTELRTRIDFEIQQRRILTRQSLFHKLYERYIAATQLVEVNIRSWLAVDHSLLEKETKLHSLIKEFNEAHDLEMQRVAALKAEVLQLGSMNRFERRLI
jgi:hypothetical protein